LPKSGNFLWLRPFVQANSVFLRYPSKQLIMKKILLALTLAATLPAADAGAQIRTAEKRSTPAKKEALMPAPSAEYNTTVFYNDRMREVKSKGAYYLQVNIGANGLPSGGAKLYSAKEARPVWEGEYFLFNRVEPEKSKYQRTCTWYHPNGQKMRESQFRDGVLDGKTTLFTEDGKPSYTGTYRNGKLQGLWTYTEANGTTGRAYMQQFDRMYDSWEQNSADGFAAVEEQALVVHSNSKEGYAVREALPVEGGRDFSLEIEFRLKAPEALILYGQRDTGNYYAVRVSGKGTIRLEQAENGMEKGSPQSFKVAMEKDNKLRIMKMGDDVFISMNGNMVSSYKFTRFYGNQLGFYVPSKNGEIWVYSIIARESGRGGVETPAEPVKEAPPKEAPVKEAPPKEKPAKRGKTKSTANMP
jgi:hypothetical protein